MYSFLIGDGSKDFPGLITRVDRLEQLEESRKFHRGVLYTATLGLFLDRFWSFFRGGH